MILRCATIRRRADNNCKQSVQLDELSSLKNGLNWHGFSNYTAKSSLAWGLTPIEPYVLNPITGTKFLALDLSEASLP